MAQPVHHRLGLVVPLRFFGGEKGRGAQPRVVAVPQVAVHVGFDVPHVLGRWSFGPDGPPLQGLSFHGAVVVRPRGFGKRPLQVWILLSVKGDEAAPVVPDPVAHQDGRRRAPLPQIRVVRAPLFRQLHNRGKAWIEHVGVRVRGRRVVLAREAHVHGSIAQHAAADQVGLVDVDHRARRAFLPQLQVVQGWQHSASTATTTTSSMTNGAVVWVISWPLENPLTHPLKPT